MTAATAPSPLLPPGLHAEDHLSAVARKRRREILLSQRNAAGAPTPDAAELPKPTAIAIEAPTAGGLSVCLSERPAKTEAGSPLPPKKRRVSVAETEENEGKKHKAHDAAAAASSHTKRPQMRYDPAVPMSKEETAAWRREQRRKRNRESAAASRQRQRDRITELEVEVGDWKAKFEEAMGRLRALEAARGLPPTDDIDVSSNDSDEKEEQSLISPCSSPDHSPRSSVVSSVPALDACRAPAGVAAMALHVQTLPQMGDGREEEERRSNEKISRPA